MVAVFQKTNEGKHRLDYGGAKTLATSQNTSSLFLETVRISACHTATSITLQKREHLCF